MINTNNLKKGIVLKLDDGVLYEVIEASHYKPGKGNAFVRAKLRNLTTGNVLDKRLRNGEKVEDVYIEKKIMQYLYEDGEGFVFMDTETYEQNPISAKVLGDNANYLKEGMEVSMRYYNDEIIGIELPAHIILKVDYTEPAVKGDTATNTTKPAKLETGYEIQVPLFVNIDDKIKVDTRTGEYIERA